MNLQYIRFTPKEELLNGHLTRCCHFELELSKVMGVPPNHLFQIGIVHDINHPAIEVSPFIAVAASSLPSSPSELLPRDLQRLISYVGPEKLMANESLQIYC